MPTVKVALSVGTLCNLKPKIRTPRMKLVKCLAQSEAGGLKSALHLTIMARLIMFTVQIQSCQGLQVLHFLVTFLLHRNLQRIQRLVDLRQVLRSRSTWMAILRLLRMLKRPGRITRWHRWFGMRSRSVSLLFLYSHLFVSFPKRGLLFGLHMV